MIRPMQERTTEGEQMASPRGHRTTGLGVGKSNYQIFQIDGSKTNWMSAGKCAQPGVDPDDWFPDTIKGRTYVDRKLEAVEVGEPLDDETNQTRARKLCRGCPIMQDCYDFAVDQRLGYGVYGGATAMQRAKGVARPGGPRELNAG